VSGLSTVDLGLRVGDGFPGPAPARLMQALRGVEVTQRDEVPCGFQLTFLAEVAGPGDVFSVASDPLLAPFNRVCVRVAVDGFPMTLIDGFITHQQFLPGNGPDEATFVVTGEDVSVKMAMLEWSREYPAMPDAAKVATVLTPWLALGIAPEIIPSLMSLVPVDFVPQQAESDRALLQRLAQANGNVFAIQPTPIPYVNTAYWGPPQRDLPPSALIDVAVGPASTADSFQAEFDALAPQTTAGVVIEREIEPFVPVPVITTMSTRMPPLAADPALSIETGLLSVRRRLWCNDQLDPVLANLQAQSETDLSTDAVVTVTAGVTPARLGKVVTAPGVVGVRGTGQAYDGLYYVKQATHQIGLRAGQGWDYTQQLTLTREGTGTTTTVLEAL